MQEARVTIVNKLGLHARAAAKLVDCAKGHASRITIARDGKAVDAKSIMSVMLLAASKGTEVDLCCAGEDEVAAMAALKALIADKFGEGE